MKKIILLLGLSVVIFANTDKNLVDAKCTICHIDKQPNALERQNLIAPPMFGVMNNIGLYFKDDKKAVTDFIKTYSLEPNQKNSKCESKAIVRFGLMPSQKGNITKEELDRIANYLYDTYLKK